MKLDLHCHLIILAKHFCLLILFIFFQTASATNCPQREQAKAYNSSLAHSQYQSYTTTKGEKVAYLDHIPMQAAWNGKTAILLSGLSRSSKYWNQHASDLIQRGYRVIRPDLLNVGETLKLNGLLRSPKLTDDARVVTELLEHLGATENIYLIGHSRGAGVALLLSRRAQFSVRHLILSNPYVEWLTNYHTNKNAQLISSMGKMFNPFWYNPFTHHMVEAANNANGYFWANVGMSMADTVSFRTDQVRRMIESREIHEQTGIEREFEIEAVLEILSGMENTSLLKVAKEVDVPTTIIAGTKDSQMVPLDLVEKLHKAIPQSRIKYVEDGHHTPVSIYETFRNWVLEIMGIEYSET